MSTQKKLISFNTVKHPEVARFFNELEDTNLTSHYVREAIKFYEQYKNQVTTTINVPTVQIEPLVEATGQEPVQSPKREDKRQATPATDKKEFVEFDPTSIFE